MNYEVGTLGNHEFNYGLNYLADAIKQAKFPIVNSNVVKAGTEEPYFTPYVIQEKSVVDNQGKTHKLKSVISVLCHRKLWFGIKQTFKAKWKPVIL